MWRRGEAEGNHQGREACVAMRPCLHSLATVVFLALRICRAGGAPAREIDAASIFSSIDLSKLRKPPLWEPTLEEYFPVHSEQDRDENGLPAPLKLTNTTWEEFALHARRGYPIIVTDWGRNMKYLRWSGKDFAKKFPFGYMKAEYIRDMPGFSRKGHDTKMIDGELRVNIRSFKPDKKTHWYNFTRPASKRYADDPQKPETGPYVWHVKDELTKEQKLKVQGRFEVPLILNDTLNRDHLNRTFEVWFSPGAGSGAGAHNDGYCESVVSLQLRGEKKWRLMMEPEMTFFSSYDEFDGGVYDAGKWQPDLAAIVGEAAAIIWPPGYLHETKTFPPPDGACGSSLTMQFAFPQPVRYIRAFLPRLSLSAEVGQCLVRKWTSYATFYITGIKPTPNGTAIEGQVAQILEVLDTDLDENITVEETLDYFKGRSEMIRYEAQQHGPLNRDLFFQFSAEDTVAYHDTDGDNIVSRQELYEALVQWNVVRMRIALGVKLLNEADREGLEALERSFDFMRRKPMEMPTRLRPELEEIFSLEKQHLPLFKSLKDVKSLSDTEFFSPVQDVLESRIRPKPKPKATPKPKAKPKAKPAGAKGKTEL